ncbi:MAG: CoA transferase, partial [Mycobacterium sp.]
MEALRVIDLSDRVSGAYCTKLFADAGADVVKVEPPTGDPLRQWSVSGMVGRDGDPDGALFRYLAASKRSVVADLTTKPGRERVLRLVAGATFVVETMLPHRIEELGLGVDALWAVNPAVTLVSISPFGRGGPRSDEDCPDFLLQALCGCIDAHGLPGRIPVCVGGRLGEWAGGAFAAAAALTASLSARRTGRGEHIDVSLLECMALTQVSYPSVRASLPGGDRRRVVGPMIPSVEPCKDGFVGLSAIIAQQWMDFARMIERPDLADDPSLTSHTERDLRREELQSAINAWTMTRTAEDIVETAALFRVPAAPVGNGVTLPRMAQLVARDAIVENPRGGFPQPRPPFRMRTPPRPFAPAPTIGEHDGDPDLNAAGPAVTQATAERTDSAAGLPLAGVKVLDFTAAWAGPITTEFLASMGADVIKVESIQRPDAMRFLVAAPAGPDWYEQGYIFNAANLGKRAITLNLGDPAGRDLALRLAADSDVVIENYTPRVMETFGLDYEAFAQVRPDIIVVRMPAFGLDGPWRDRPGFATTMEQMSGMGWITGYRDEPPLLPNGYV